MAHSLLLYFFMHTVKGTPFHTADQGMSRFLTAWEQMDGEVQVSVVFLDFYIDITQYM